jgi:hypothetical protein
MEDEPTLYPADLRALTPEVFAELFRHIAGREPTEDEMEGARHRWRAVEQKVRELKSPPAAGEEPTRPPP